MHINLLLFTTLLVTLAAAIPDFSSEFIDPATFVTPPSVVAERSNLASRSPFRLCLYNTNTVPLDQIQAGMKHLADLGQAMCVVKVDDRWHRRVRFTGVGEGQIYGVNFRQDEQDAASYCSDVAIAVQDIIDRCTSDYNGIKVVGGMVDANGNGDISVSIGAYFIDPPSK